MTDNVNVEQMCDRITEAFDARDSILHAELLSDLAALAREAEKKRIRDHGGHIHPLGHFCGSNCPMNPENAAARACNAEKRAADSHEVMIRVYARAEAAEADRDHQRERANANWSTAQRIEADRDHWREQERLAVYDAARLARRVAELEADPWKRGYDDGYGECLVWLRKAERRVAELEAALREAGPMFGISLGDPGWTPERARERVRAALAGDGGAARTVEDDYAEFAKGTLRSPGLTEHDAFARCPHCGHATVGLSPPYVINHAKDCAAGDGGGACAPNHYGDRPCGGFGDRCDCGDGGGA